jgi:hypothetical protein
LSTYEITPQLPGNSWIDARFFESEPAPEDRQKKFLSGVLWDRIQLSVMGNDYMQSDSRWGNLKYGSMNPKWKDAVDWDVMNNAGCGPTALATVLDYLVRLFAASSPAASITPLDTMKFSSQYGRWAAPDKDGILKGAGTSVQIMLANIGKYWPGLAGERIGSVDLAVRWLRAGSPLIFQILPNTGIQVWKYDSRGRKDVHTWNDGHIMVLLGVESNSQGPDQRFWIADPSLARSKYIDAANLSRCLMWRVYKAA